MGTEWAILRYQRTWVIVFKLATMQVARSSSFIIICKPWLVLVFQRIYLILPLILLSFIADFLRMVVCDIGSLPGSIGEESIMFWSSIIHVNLFALKLYHKWLLWGNLPFMCHSAVYFKLVIESLAFGRAINPCQNEEIKCCI
jgi:hypothetical protein